MSVTVQELIDAYALDLAERLTRLLVEADEFGSSATSGSHRLSHNHTGYGLFGSWKKGVLVVREAGSGRRGWY